MNPLVAQPLAQDFLKVHLSPEYNFEEVYIRNNTVAEIVVETAGVPLIQGAGNDYDVVLAGAEATATHFCVARQKLTLPAGEKSQFKLRVLARGMAVVEKSGMPANDYAGTAYDKDALQLRLEAMNPPVIVRDNSSNLVAKPKTD